MHGLQNIHRNTEKTFFTHHWILLEAESDFTPFNISDSITLCMYGNEPCKYRVSMYINHELVKGAFDGADYIDITQPLILFVKNN